jgi:hypothetical protein
MHASTKLTLSLIGILRNSNVSKKDYKKYLEKKFL